MIAELHATLVVLCLPIQLDVHAVSELLRHIEIPQIGADYEERFRHGQESENLFNKVFPQTLDPLVLALNVVVCLLLARSVRVFPKPGRRKAHPKEKWSEEGTPEHRREFPIPGLTPHAPQRRTPHSSLITASISGAAASAPWPSSISKNFFNVSLGLRLLHLHQATHLD